MPVTPPACIQRLFDMMSLGKGPGRAAINRRHLQPLTVFLRTIAIHSDYFTVPLKYIYQ